MKLKTSFILFCVLIPFTLAFRMFQFGQMIEPATTLIYPEYEFVQKLFVVFIVAVMVMFLALNRFSNDLPTALPKGNTSLFVVSLLVAFAFVQDIFINIFDVSGSFHSLVNFYTTAGEPKVLVNNLFIIAYFILAIMCAAAFVINALAFKSCKSINGLANIPICILLLITLFVSFIAQAGSALTNENGLTILAIAFTLLFFLTHARLVSSIDYKKSLKWVVGTGLFAAFLLIITEVPRYITLIAGRGDLLRTNSQPSFLLTILAIYIIVLLYVLCCADSNARKRSQLRNELVIIGKSDVPEPKIKKDKFSKIDEALIVLEDDKRIKENAPPTNIVEKAPMETEGKMEEEPKPIEQNNVEPNNNDIEDDTDQIQLTEIEENEEQLTKPVSQIKNIETEAEAELNQPIVKVNENEEIEDVFLNDDING